MATYRTTIAFVRHAVQPASIPGPSHCAQDSCSWHSSRLHGFCYLALVCAELAGLYASISPRELCNGSVNGNDRATTDGVVLLLIQKDMCSYCSGSRATKEEGRVPLATTHIALGSCNSQCLFHDMANRRKLQWTVHIYSYSYSSSRIITYHSVSCRITVM